MAKKAKTKHRTKSSASYLSPGVYMEEVSSGARPIEAVGTAVAAFVGLAPSALRLLRRHPVVAVVAGSTVVAAVAAVVRAPRG